MNNENACVSCNEFDPQCTYCDNKNCYYCGKGFYLNDNSLCSEKVACLAKYCLECDNTNSLKCLYCEGDYLVDENYTCIVNICPVDTQFYNISSNKCDCYFGYLKN